ncbi:uncharacterized protein LOC127012037 [Drosophila biarmipes]|uniref:uncharacterized protein LOC127012037 n=1 Tax=Drosophila biarmipes TaxID=125945 RepID=UPI0021CC676A|nr:uncharacterized protein LOC127012037 [Drosophila biarmipes]
MRPRDQRDGSIRLDGGGKQCVKDKRVKQGPWTLDPMWRVLACRVQKGNNGSQRPYINPQGAGSEISQSGSVVEISQSRSVIEKSQSRSVIQHQSSSGDHTVKSGQSVESKESSEAAPWEPTRSKIVTSRRSGLGLLGISELRHRWLRSKEAPHGQVLFCPADEVLAVRLEGLPD